MSPSHLASILIALALGACARVHVTPDELSAASSVRRRPPPVAPAASLAESDLDADPELAAGRRALLLRAASMIEGRPLGGPAPASEAGLLAELLGELSLGGAPRGPDPDLADWLESARPRHGRLRTGDLVVFRRVADEVPRVAVVLTVHRDGLVEALASTREAWRRIRLHPERPAVRRASGRILNTFIRTRRADDAPGQAYLAGQLIDAVYTMLD
jgi:hypothetical protein